MDRPWSRRAAVLLGVLALSSCATSPGEGAGVDFVTAPEDVLRCGGDAGRRGATVALVEGAGQPDPLAAVEDAQATGLLPPGDAEVVDEQGDGVVRSDGGTVIAGFLVEDVGDGWHVTTVETCVSGP